ncbi:MAG TPA: hypothetical protein VHU90_03260 [Galbitalea sp.]|jgi:hypothetical protein|nr:hypothetical protein [Galbitalea sp.]
MSDHNDAEIDPRFDPAFQRGFDPSIPIEEYVPAQLPRKSATASHVAEPIPAPPVATPPVAPAKPMPPQATAAPDPEAAAPGELPDADLEPAADPALDSSPSRNPFLLFLGIISIALVAAGIWLFVRSGDAFNSKEVRSQGDYMSLTATIDMAPFIALLGGATAIGVLFVFAARWRRRR